MIARVFTRRVAALLVALLLCHATSADELENPGSTLSPTPAGVSSGDDFIFDEFDLGLEGMPSLQEAPPISGEVWSPDRLDSSDSASQGEWDAMFQVGLDGTIKKKFDETFLGNHEPSTSVAAATFSDVNTLEDDPVAVSESALVYPVKLDAEKEPTVAVPVMHSRGTFSGLTRRLLVWGGFAAVFAVGCLLVGGALSSRSAPPPRTPIM